MTARISSVHLVDLILIIILPSIFHLALYLTVNINLALYLTVNINLALYLNVNINHPWCIKLNHPQCINFSWCPSFLGCHSGSQRALDHVAISLLVNIVNSIYIPTTQKINSLCSRIDCPAQTITLCIKLSQVVVKRHLIYILIHQGQVRLGATLSITLSKA